MGTIMSPAAAIAEIRAIERRCLGPLPGEVRERIQALLAVGDADTARRLNRSARTGCDADFNDIIANGPWDGLEHDYRCPSCGLHGRYRAPAFPGLEER